MKLRVVSGMLKGRYVQIPERDSSFRPTRERIRTSVANILSRSIPHAAVADICAGSGIFGFEMISRGAREVVFVESDRHRCRLIEKHAEKFNIARQCSCFEQDAMQFMYQCSRRFDIIYFDPPYDEKHFTTLVEPLCGMLAEDGVLIYERRTIGKRNKPDADGEQRLPPFRSRVYGETEICLFSEEPEESLSE